MRRSLLLGISALLLISLVPLTDWIRYRDSKPFVPPIHYTGELPIRKDYYGDGRFGASRSNGRSHKGLDICSPLYGEVIASKGGRVEVGFSENGIGKYIIIKHPGEYVTLYGHLSKCCVEERQRIRQGTIIGYVGKTGNAKYKGINPHLHFEIMEKGEYVDPLQFLE